MSIFQFMASELYGQRDKWRRRVARRTLLPLVLKRKEYCCGDLLHCKKGWSKTWRHVQWSLADDAPPIAGFARDTRGARLERRVYLLYKQLRIFLKLNFSFFHFSFFAWLEKERVWKRWKEKISEMEPPHTHFATIALPQHTYKHTDKQADACKFPRP